MFFGLCSDRLVGPPQNTAIGETCKKNFGARPPKPDYMATLLDNCDFSATVIFEHYSISLSLCLCNLHVNIIFFHILSFSVTYMKVHKITSAISN